MIDVTTLLIMASCVCSGLSIMFTFYAYMHPENVPWMQGLFDIFRKKDNSEDEMQFIQPTTGPVQVGVGGLPPMEGSPPTSCIVSQADLATWNAECAANQDCINERQMRKCGPLQVVFT